MKTQNSANSAVKDSLGFGAAVIDTAYTGLSEAVKLGEQILAKQVAAQQGGVDTVAIGAEIAELELQIGAIAASADFEGQNLLSAAGALAGFTVVSGYAAGAVTTIDVATYDLEAADFTDLTTTEATLDGMRAAAASMGASKMRVDSQLDFTSKLMDAIDRGVGVLVDADMNAESARLSALQTQQQLGIQALSIANQGSQSVLSLFR